MISTTTQVNVGKSAEVESPRHWITDAITQVNGIPTTVVLKDTWRTQFQNLALSTYVIGKWNNNGIRISNFMEHIQNFLLSI